MPKIPKEAVWAGGGAGLGAAIAGVVVDSIHADLLGGNLIEVIFFQFIIAGVATLFGVTLGIWSRGP